MKHTALIIFVRKPEWGKVKTRLARTIGNDKALLIYSKLLEHTHAISKNLTCDKYIFYAEGIPDDDIWETPPYHKKQQEGEDLGARMKNAFADVFAMGYRKVLIIGSDCYQLRDEDISEAFDWLDRYDVVLGPSIDGGYYLLGLKKPAPRLFEGIAWSTESVAAQTISILNELKIEHYLLKPLLDLDEEGDLPEDLRALAALPKTD